MPIEIKELIVKTTITGNSENNNSGSTELDSETLNNLKKEISEELFALIMEQISKNKER